MSTLAVIPARLGATRLPRKPLRLLGGVPLVVRVLERVQSLRLADRVENTLGRAGRSTLPGCD